MRNVQRIIATGTAVVVCLGGIAALILSSFSPSLGGPGAVFGPYHVIRAKGKPVIDIVKFDISNPAMDYVLWIDNGGMHGEFKKISSAVITLNGVQVAGPSDFNQMVTHIEKPVGLRHKNTLSVELRSQPGAGLTIQITAVTEQAPPVGDLAQARAGHTATVLPDGGVLITGGTGSTGVLDTAELIDPATQSVAVLANRLTTPRTGHTATLLPQTETLIVAGYGDTDTPFRTERFHPTSGDFLALAATVQFPRSGHTATALLDGRVVIVGGQGSTSALGEAEVFDAQPAVLFTPAYDPENATFTVLDHGLVTPRWDHTVTLLPDGRILIAGGRNGSGILNSAEIFNPATKEFTALPSAMTTPRAGHTATLRPDGTVLILGGENTSGVLDTAEVFDPVSGAFASTGSHLCTPRVNHTGTLLPSGWVLITGGENTSGLLATMELYPSAAQDGTEPTVTAVWPLDGATGVNPTQIIGVRFSEPVDVRTLNSASVTLTGGGPVEAIVSPGEQGLMVFLVPSAPLATGTSYMISLTEAITDTAGNPLTPFTSQFTTQILVPPSPPPPTIMITEPADGATVPEGMLIVRGMITAGGAEVGVTVNGILASVQGTIFAALLPVTPDTITITAVTTTAAGGTASDTIGLTVTSAPDPNLVVRLQPSPPSGVAPLIVAFSLLGGPVPTNINLDFDGNGTVDFSGPSLVEQTFTYAQPGLFFPTVTVTDADNNQITASTIVRVEDQTALDTLLQGKWTALKDALRQGDIPQALLQIYSRSRPSYEAIFHALPQDLPNVDLILTNIQLLEVRRAEALYEMVRTDNGVVKSFEIRFRLDDDGIWRLWMF